MANCLRLEGTNTALELCPPFMIQKSLEPLTGQLPVFRRRPRRSHERAKNTAGHGEQRRRDSNLHRHRVHRPATGAGDDRGSGLRRLFRGPLSAEIAAVSHSSLHPCSWLRNDPLLFCDRLPLRLIPLLGSGRARLQPRRKLRKNLGFQRLRSQRGSRKGTMGSVRVTCDLDIPWVAGHNARVGLHVRVA
jgi:hypothetical protein